MKLRLIIITVLLSTRLFADGYYPEPLSQDQPWSLTASVGGGKYQQMHENNASILGRLALGNEMMLTGDLAWGFELGIQNGHKMYLPIPNETLALLEWLPVKTSLGPTIDLLITAKTDPLVGGSLFAQLKAGIAYRKWQVEHKAINELSQLAGEIQAGFGYPLTTLTSLNLLYQGVFGNDPNLAINPYNKTARVSSIPSLHAVLLGLSVNI